MNAPRGFGGCGRAVMQQQRKLGDSFHEPRLDLLWWRGAPHTGAQGEGAGARTTSSRSGHENVGVSGGHSGPGAILSVGGGRTRDGVTVYHATPPPPERATPPPKPPGGTPLAQTRARFWFQDQKCGNTGSPCLDKPVLARGTYCGTQVAGIAQPIVHDYERVSNRPAYTPEYKSTWNHSCSNTLSPILTLPASCTKL